ncbi:hypothetical protein [Rubritalea profundi]|uniref:Uncharacterized protein n=1 Tax=Rubritalea profundi TaxID=1658618 RepID=A0A2S7U451_9BACT|nr:hypothetical protein [Rubritalea profundi]PQJ29287.1 hypothetical protein BSZ32_12820 [Rubritalea profundi]
MNFIRKPHFPIIALTVIVLSTWLGLKTDKSSSNSDVPDQRSGRHTVSQVADSTSTTGSENTSGTMNASTAPVQAKEIVGTNTKADHAHNHTQLVAAVKKLHADKANQAKAAPARPAINDPRALRPFGKDAPFVINDLPDGKLKENLLALTPNHKA